MKRYPFFDYRSIRRDQEIEITRTIAASQVSIHEHEAGRRGILKEIEYLKEIKYQEGLKDKLPRTFKRDAARHWASQERDDEINRLEWLLYWHDQSIIHAKNSILSENRRLAQFMER